MDHKIRFMVRTLIEDKIKIFEHASLRERINNCLEEGYFPASKDTIILLKKAEVLAQSAYYDSSTIRQNDALRDATLEDLKNIEDIYSNGGGLLKILGDETYEAVFHDGGSLREIAERVKNWEYKNCCDLDEWGYLVGILSNKTKIQYPKPAEILEIASKYLIGPNKDLFEEDMKKLYRGGK